MSTDTDPSSKAPLRQASTSKLIPGLLRPGNLVLVRFQEALNVIFSPALNPLYFLGAITFLLFWVLLVTGVYLYLYYEMNPVGAYESVRFITEDQAYYGGIIRSLHRYASEGIMIAMTIHVLQVFFSDRFRKYRWVAWVTGAFIIPVMWFEGISGYILVWDESAQMMALWLSDILDVMPINSEPLQRNFISNDTVNSTLFFVLNFLHLAVPFLLLILAWVHCMRISMPMINPPKIITIIVLGSLLAVSLIKPAISAAPADLGKLVGETSIDWFFLPLFPVLDYFNVSPTTAFYGGAVLYILFLLLPWMIWEPKKKGLM